MDIYIIMTASITKVGGAQLYTNYKREYMESKGFFVEVFSCKPGAILIKDFDRYKDNIIEELGFLPMYYRKKRQKRIIERIATRFEGNDHRIIIESHNTTMHVWGELLAERLSAKHIVYEITERSKCKKSLYPFFKFKYERGEMAGIRDSSLQYYFQDYLKLPVSDRYSLLAYYPSKPVDDVQYDVDCIPDAAPMCTIGILGRLDKPFVMEVAAQLKDFVENESGKQYTIVIIGGQKEGNSTQKRIEEIYKNIGNVSLVFTGYLYPIPRCLLKKIDIGISSSGAVIAMADENVPTIVIDAHDMQPLGVYGITTDNILYRKGEDVVKLSDWIKRIQNHPERYKRNICMEKDDEDHLAHHLAFINDSERSVKYYTNFPNEFSIKQLILGILGTKKFKRIRTQIRHILK